MHPTNIWKMKNPHVQACDVLSWYAWLIWGHFSLVYLYIRSLIKETKIHTKQKHIGLKMYTIDSLSAPPPEVTTRSKLLLRDSQTENVKPNCFILSRQSTKNYKYIKQQKLQIPVAFISELKRPDDSVLKGSASHRWMWVCI